MAREMHPWPVGYLWDVLRMEPESASRVEGSDTRTDVIKLVLMKRPVLARAKTIHLLVSFKSRACPSKTGLEGESEASEVVDNSSGLSCVISMLITPFSIANRLPAAPITRFKGEYWDGEAM